MKNLKKIVLALFISYFIINFFNIDENLMNVYRYFLLIVLISYAIYSIKKESIPHKIIKERIVLSLLSLFIIVISYFVINY